MSDTKVHPGHIVIVNPGFAGRLPIDHPEHPEGFVSINTTPGVGSEQFLCVDDDHAAAVLDAIDLEYRARGIHPSTDPVTGETPDHMPAYEQWFVSATLDSSLRQHAEKKVSAPRRKELSPLVAEMLKTHGNNKLIGEMTLHLAEAARRLNNFYTAVAGVTYTANKLHLCTASPGTSTSIANEVTGGSYAAQTATFGTASGSPETVANNLNITFASMPAVSSAFGDIDGTVSATTTPLNGFALTSTVTTTAGQSISFAVGALTISDS